MRQRKRERKVEREIETEKEREKESETERERGGREREEREREKRGIINHSICCSCCFCVLICNGYSISMVLREQMSEQHLVSNSQSL